MSEIAAELARVRSAYEQPTLTLLGKDTAPVVLAVFRSLFTTERPRIATLAMHDAVDDLVNELRHLGHDSIPTGNGRDLCQRWLHDRWLRRVPDDSGTEYYELSASTHDALRLVGDLTSERPVGVSEHRIASLLTLLRRLNAEINPDRSARVRALEIEIENLTSRLDHLLEDADHVEVTDEYLLNGYIELLRHIKDLPSEFTRVVEAFARFGNSKLEEFRREDRTTGEVIDAYLAHAASLAAATPEGRAFAGALDLLRDEELQALAKADIEGLLSDPRARDILHPTEFAQLKGVMRTINANVQRALNERTKTTTTLREYVRSHDVASDRELASALRLLEAELTIWMKTAGPRARIPVEIVPGRLSISHLRERLHDPADDIPPERLSQKHHPTESLTLAELLARGGPSHGRLAEILDARLAAGGDAVSLGEVFNALPNDLRRPVEVYGLLPLSITRKLAATAQNEALDTVRADGTQRRLMVPQYATTTPEAHDVSRPTTIAQESR